MVSYVNGRTNSLNLSQLCYTHYWVNHTEGYVHNIFSDIHTNNIAIKTYISHTNHTKRNIKSNVLKTYINSVFIL